jgi:hypothetical protein
MPIAQNHPSLCVFHSRAEQQLLDPGQVPDRLVSLSGKFRTATDINHVLGQLFRLVAENRIPHREALSLAYIAQLMLQTLPLVHAELDSIDSEEWQMTVQEALRPDVPDEEADDPPPSSESPAAPKSL